MFDANWSDPQTFWLNVTNAGLGIVTLVALFSVLGAVAVELYGRVKKRATTDAPDFHTLHVPTLGLTMADGGEKIDEKGASTSKEQTSGKDRQ